MSAQNIRKTGASAIHGIDAVRPATAARKSGSCTTMIAYCCRSDFEGADWAQASSTSSNASGTGCAR